MSVVAVCEAAGTSASTTTALLLAASMPEHPTLLMECDPSGGDVAAWCGLRETPGWGTAAVTGDRSWVGLRGHMQELPSRLAVLTAPTRGAQARVAVRESDGRFGPLLRSMPDVIAVADCGRIENGPPVWTVGAQRVVLLVRQSSASPGATLARVDRAGEALEMLRAADAPVSVVVIGARPYSANEVALALDWPVWATLPEDPAGAALAAGAWTIGKGASRSPLARAARPIAARVVDELAGLASLTPLDRDVEAAG